MAGAYLMLAADLIRVVEQAGGHLSPDGDGLVVEAPEPLPAASHGARPVVTAPAWRPKGLFSPAGAEGRAFLTGQWDSRRSCANG